VLAAQPKGFDSGKAALRESSSGRSNSSGSTRYIDGAWSETKTGHSSLAGSTYTLELFEWPVSLAWQLGGLALLVLAEDRDLVVLDIHVGPPKPDAPIVPTVFQDLAPRTPVKASQHVGEGFVRISTTASVPRSSIAFEGSPVDVIQERTPLAGRPELLVATHRRWSFGQLVFGDGFLGRVLADLVPLEAVIEERRDVIVVGPRRRGAIPPSTPGGLVGLNARSRR